MNLTQVNFPEDQYIKKEYPKTQIYLHHTAGNSNPFGVYKDWESSPSRIATCVVIGGNPGGGGNWDDGEIIQGFSSRYYAYHLGVKLATFKEFNLPYIKLDAISIGIEICNWGQLEYKNGKFYHWANGIVPESDVVELSDPFKGFQFYHEYTDAQIESIRDLLIYWNNRYGIPINYEPDIFNLTERPFKGEPGVYTHNSVRPDKFDISPQPKMVEMLISL